MIFMYSSPIASARFDRAHGFGTRIGKMSVYFLCRICGSKTLQTSFKMRERSRARFSEQAMVRGLETSGLVRRVFLRIAQRL